MVPNRSWGTFPSHHHWTQVDEYSWGPHREEVEQGQAGHQGKPWGHVLHGLKLRGQGCVSQVSRNTQLGCP